MVRERVLRARARASRRREDTTFTHTPRARAPPFPPRRTWKGFTSTARKDGAALSHWVRSDVDLPDYPFARFNRRVDIVRYSDDEYAALCTPSDEVMRAAQAAAAGGGASAAQTDQDVRWLKVRRQARWGGARSDFAPRARRLPARAPSPPHAPLLRRITRTTSLTSRAGTTSRGP